jgi:hypothetical protein
MTNESSPEYEDALDEWVLHKRNCNFCRLKSFCDDGRKLRYKAIALINATWRYSERSSGL